ncbi:MAG: lipocalin family protein, partial [Verrucomicrobiales bacterium]|nr:lipocalin family protein [Verrucomicrobiales bacterium]
NRLDRTWKSDTTDATYPVAWTIALPAQNLTLTTTTTFPDQEFTTESISYWEGAVRVGGSTPGRGYLEMTGYSGTALSRALSQ